MNPYVLSSYPEIQELHVAEMVRYLQQNHWKAVNHPNPKLLVFENGVDDFGKPIQIVLPSKDEYEDRPHLVAIAVNLLSVLASVSFQKTVDEISTSVGVG
jgi:hypothetical protein